MIFWTIDPLEHFFAIQKWYKSSQILIKY